MPVRTRPREPQSYHLLAPHLVADDPDAAARLMTRSLRTEIFGYELHYHREVR